MKQFTLSLLLFVLAVAAVAQTTHEAGAGASFCPGCSPVAGGTGYYKTPISQSTGTSSISILDVLPVGWKPLTFITGTETGIDQKVFSPKLPLICKNVTCDVDTVAAAGPAWTGANGGWNWQVAGTLSRPIGEGNVGRLWVRVNKSSIAGSQQSGYNLAVSITYGWRW